jgi:arginyl-tRNA synthetase
VDAIEIAGPGFLNIRLKPAAKQEVVREVLAQARFGCQADRGENILVEFVSANPTGPLHVGHGRQGGDWRRHQQPVSTQGWKVHREFYYNDAGVQIDTLTKSTQLRAKGFKPGDECWPTDSDNPLAKNFYNGDYIADIAQAFLAKETVKADDREFTANGDVEDYDNIRQFAVAYLRNEQDKDLQAFNLQFDEYYLESSLYTSGRVEATVNKLIANGKTYEQDGALWLKSTDYGDDKDRVMRKTDGTYTYFVPDVAYHIPSGSAASPRSSTSRARPPRHHRPRARRPAGGRCGHSPGLPRLRAAHHGARGARRRGGQDQQARRQLRHAARPDRVDQQGRGALLPALAQARHRIHLRRRSGRGPEQRQPGVLRAVRPCAHLLGAARLAGAGGAVAAGRGPVALEGPQAQALMLQLAKYPEMLTAAAEGKAPHDVTFYLRDLAASYHSYYDAERILVDDEAVKLARLALVAATAQVLHNGLAVLGVSAPSRM